MERYILTIEKYEKVDPAEVPTGSGMRHSYDNPRTYRDDMLIPPKPSERVLTLDVTEDQYKAIKKAALETF